MVWDKAPVEIDKEAAAKFDRIANQHHEREVRLQRHYDWRGGKLPPFNIEPQPRQRQRLSGAGMTPEDRIARRQWLVDQELAPNEPVYIKELYPKNVFRRAAAKPWDVLFNMMRPILGESKAKFGRWFVPRLAMSLGAVWVTWYHLKYHGNSWEGTRGFHMYQSRTQYLPGDAGWPNIVMKEADDFNDRGFKKRAVFVE